jgi:hypothetical protein
VVAAPGEDLDAGVEQLAHRATPTGPELTPLGGRAATPLGLRAAAAVAGGGAGSHPGRVTLADAGVSIRAVKLTLPSCP